MSTIQVNANRITKLIKPWKSITMRELLKPKSDSSEGKVIPRKDGRGTDTDAGTLKY